MSTMMVVKWANVNEGDGNPDPGFVGRRVPVDGQCSCLVMSQESSWWWLGKQQKVWYSYLTPRRRGR